jgi:hypothetical protein
MVEGGSAPAVHWEPSAAKADTGPRAWPALAISIAVLTTLVGCGYAVASKPACADAVLEDWTQGTLDSVYPQDCYGAAIDALPEDLRAYTSAADDISRAALAANRVIASAASDRDGSATRRIADAPMQGDGLRAIPTEVVVLGVVVTVLGASGLAASVVRRRRPR